MSKDIYIRGGIMNDVKKSFFCKCSDFLKNYQFSTVLQFALLNGFIWMLMSVSYLRYVNFIRTSWSGVVYSLIFTVGHLGVFSFGLWIVLQLCRFAGKRFFAFSSIFWSSMLIFLLFSDIIVYSLYRFHINIPMLALFCSPAAFELVELPLTMVICIILIIMAILCGEILLFKVVHKFSCPKSALAVLAVIAVSFVAF